MTSTTLTNTNTPKITIVIQLGGEMGNHLSRIAFGYALHWILQEDYQMTSEIVLRHQDNSKWMRTQYFMQTCFPKLQAMNFSQGNTPELDQKWQQQKDFFGNATRLVHYAQGSFCDDAICIQRHTKELQKVLQQIKETTNSAKNLIPNNTTATTPQEVLVMAAQCPQAIGHINDRYNDRFQTMFQMDSSCCNRTEIYDVVIHIRAFQHEMPKQSKRLHYQELPPEQMVQQLSDHDKNSSIAVVGRFPDFVKPYLTALQQQGYERVQYIPFKTGEETFCFLQQPHAEMIGISVSTFYLWAAYLGSAQKTRIYSIDATKTKGMQKIHGDDWEPLYSYNFAHNLELKQKIQWDFY
eukprot:CAMPEP_0178896888 /NCGR_PEP_ID=MMETSP0786-20121207/1435_1 /TAXON_ID=186022 /ORGANISM="Thalassionema frauenfeldii, Strain CCMP 1798" /LENGTH=351 /DNA_ID=CAMNT_0020567365 /DNA_START=105 /DNA_END=1160 /DNA_ORIENTATION=+